MNYLFTPGIYGLLGPNGAGKSTLMNIISDVIDSSEGSVEYMGKNIKNMKAEYRKHIGYLPQNTGLYPEFTLTEMLEYFAYLRGLDKSKIPEMMEKVLTGTNLLSKKMINQNIFRRNEKTCSNCGNFYCRPGDTYI